MKDQIQKITNQAEQEIAKTTSTEQLIEIEKKFVGRKGLLTDVLKGLKDLSIEEKKEIGAFANESKQKLESQIEQQRNKLKKAEIEKSLKDDWIDVTLPGIHPTAGHIHPISQIYKEVEQIFGEMGFQIVDGPEVESEYYNFEALNIPATHPARDMQDTFFLDKEPDEKHSRLVLRTHTSPNQVRAMEQYGVPIRIIVPGRVFRYEATDATHESTFDQVEGLLIDKNISLADLKGIMLEFLSRLFGREMKIRFRPGYFPFVEPGIELDISCPFCQENSNCRVCKNQRYIEFMGAGMTHPRVLEYAGVDPKEYQGWAFGFGLTRLAMMKHEIKDIRHFLSGDLRFTNQF